MFVVKLSTALMESGSLEEMMLQLCICSCLLRSTIKLYSYWVMFAESDKSTVVKIIVCVEPDKSTVV